MQPHRWQPTRLPHPWILQARTLEWVAIAFSTAWKGKVKVKSLSRVRLLATPWTAAYQAPPSMGFSRQEYWSWVPLPSPSLYLGNFKINLIHWKYKFSFSSTMKTYNIDILTPGWGVWILVCRKHESMKSSNKRDTWDALQKDQWFRVKG